MHSQNRGGNQTPSIKPNAANLMDTTSLVKFKSSLPDSIERLRDFILVGQEKIRAYQAKVRAIEKVGLAKSVRDQTLSEAQDVATAVLYAEAKLGELLKGLADPTASRDGRRQLPPGITHKQSHYAQLLANNIEIVEKVIREAKQEEDIPTRYAVLRALDEIKREKRIKEEEMKKALSIKNSGLALITKADYKDWLPEQPMCDLLITDPPYSTEIEDIESFAEDWLPLALSKVKDTGRAYVFIGAYPEELRAYLGTYFRIKPKKLILEQILGWAYHNTIGPSPKLYYTNNYQNILYFLGPKAPPLDCPDLTEKFAFQLVNAPDGRTGIRYHTWEKPIELAEMYIRHSTSEGQLVLDCFAGTGTFLLAAARLGRHARGCDISEEMVNIAVSRGCERYGV